MLVLTDWLPPINYKSKINYILILNPEHPIEKVLDQVDFDCLLLDQSISKKDEKRWMRACKREICRFILSGKRVIFVLLLQKIIEFSL